MTLVEDFKGLALAVMDTVSLILVVLFMLALTVRGVPGVVRLNKGKMLPNMALWLAIVLGLALVYRHFGPNLGAPPSVQTPDAMEDQATGDNGYTPPGE